MVADLYACAGTLQNPVSWDGAAFLELTEDEHDKTTDKVNRHDVTLRKHPRSHIDF